MVLLGHYSKYVYLTDKQNNNIQTSLLFPLKYLSNIYFRLSIYNLQFDGWMRSSIEFKTNLKIKLIAQQLFIKDFKIFYFSIKFTWTIFSLKKLTRSDLSPKFVLIITTFLLLHKNRFCYYLIHNVFDLADDRWILIFTQAQVPIQIEERSTDIYIWFAQNIQIMWNTLAGENKSLILISNWVNGAHSRISSHKKRLLARCCRSV